MALRSTTAALLALSAGCTCGSTAPIPSANRLNWSPAAAPHRLDFSQLSRGVLPDHSLKTRGAQLQTLKEDQRHLVSRAGYLLEIHPDGSVKGTFNTDSEYGVLTFTYYMVSIMLLLGRSEDPIVQIRGKETGLWLCMNPEGELFTKFEGRNDEECQFRYKSHNNFKVFYNNKYPLQNSDTRTQFFYIALSKRTGLPRTGIDRTHKSAQFQPLPVYRPRSETRPPLNLYTTTTQSPNLDTSDEPSSSRSFRTNIIRPNSESRRRNQSAPGRHAAAPEDVLLSSFESVLLGVRNAQNKRLIKYSSGMELPHLTFNIFKTPELLRHSGRKNGHRRKSKKRKGKRTYIRAQARKHSNASES